MRELVERARHGDHEAFSRLVAADADRMYATAYLVLRDRESAEDAVQDAYLKAWRDLPSLRDPERYDSWLRRLLIRACIDQFRRRRRRPPEVALVPTHAPVGADFSGHVADADQLARVFAGLSIEHRSVVVLAHFDALSTAEIASTLGIPIGTVKSRLHHALRAMRGAIEAGERMASNRKGEAV